MTHNPFPESRLLSGRNRMSVVERERIRGEVLRHSSRQGASRRLLGWAFGGAVASTALALLLIYLPSSEPADEFSARGAGPQLGFTLSCLNPSGESSCHDGSSLLFRTWAPADQPYFASFARSEDGTVIWYAPSKEQELSVDTRKDGPGGVLSHGVHIGPEHSVGTHTVYGLFSANPLPKADVRDRVERAMDGDAASQSLFHVELKVDATP